MEKSSLLVVVLVLLTTTLFTSCLASGEADIANLPEGENVCIDQTPENKTINVTYLETYDVKEYTWCLKIPPRCPVWRTKMVTRYQSKNITRIVNHHRCCAGYEQTNGKCIPVCTSPCLRGTCVEPDVCSCQAGFSGADCGEVGCPGGNWGADCAQPCPCTNGGRCEAKTGVCQCLPGWDGLHCQNRCDSEHFGQDCDGACACAVGSRCHHVTGDCAPCPAGSFGLRCQGNCSCSAEGTALCYHENGNCFCNANYYGRSCEMFCPFGYLNGTCHSQPMASGYCSCASDLYRCDKDKGCVCKDGFDCEGGTHFVELASLTSTDASSSSSRTTYISVIVTLLLLALIVTILFVVYYRRRMRRMQKDLEHRSVRFIENSVHPYEPKRGGGEVVVVDGGGDVEANNSSPNNAANNSSTNNINNFASSRGAIAKKNVNIDKFKLGGKEEQPEDEDDSSRPDGAGSSPPQSDVNVFQEVKSNERLAALYRKPKVDAVMKKNNSKEEEADTEDEDLGSEDENDDTELKQFEEIRMRNDDK